MAFGVGDKIVVATVEYDASEVEIVTLNPEQWRDLLADSDSQLDHAWTKKAERAVTALTKQAVWRRDDFRCVYCRKGMGLTVLTIDHFVPESLGGGNEFNNLVSCCKRCNRIKADSHPSEWLAANRIDYHEFVSRVFKSNG